MARELSSLEARILAETDPNENNEDVLECAVCLQPCIHPVQLQCKHIFCFLCVKGVAIQSKRCPMCRGEIPLNYLDCPHLVEPLKPVALRKLPPTTSCGQNEGEEAEAEASLWFYEGRNGWWQYDERTTEELESHFKKGDKSCELLIAGFLYTIDLEQMLQYRRNEPSRRRRIKRDLPDAPTKGIAGLRCLGNQPERQDDSQSQATSSTSHSSGGGEPSTMRQLEAQVVRDLSLIAHDSEDLQQSDTQLTQDSDFAVTNNTPLN